MRGERPSTWIAVDVALPWAPRVRALCRLIGCETADAYVVRVMTWLKQHARDGQVTRFSDDIADAIRWPAGPYALGDAFARVGLTDAAGVLIGWPDLNGWLVTRAERDRERHRKPGRNLDRHGRDGRTVGGTEGRRVGGTEFPGVLRGGSAEQHAAEPVDRSRRKTRA